MMNPRDYELHVSGSGNVRIFQLKKLSSNYPLPQYVDATLRVNDAEQNTPEGMFFRKYMDGSGIEEIRFDWDTHSIHVTGATAFVFNDIDGIEHLIRTLINGHFIATRKVR